MTEENLYFETDSTEPESEVDSTVAIPENVKNNYTFKNPVTRESLVGTMPINQSTSVKINPKSERYTDNEYIIPKGYHSGSGKVVVGDLSEYTFGTATPDKVAMNETFWVNGKREVGTLDISPATQAATAKESDIVEGKTAWVNGVKITGNIPILPRMDQTLMAGEYYEFPYGLSYGTTMISAAPLSIQTQGTATQNDIADGKTAWVDGEQIIGNMITQNINLVRVIVGHNTSLQPGYYPSGLRIYALYSDVLDMTGSNAYVIDRQLNNVDGYVDSTTLHIIGIV